MRWDHDNRYVRVARADDAAWRALSWEARALFMELARKVDPEGRLPMGRAGVAGLAALLRMPGEVVDRALVELEAGGLWTWGPETCRILGGRGDLWRPEATPNWSKEHYPEVYARDGRACRYCGTTALPLSIDHVVPRSHGGGDEPSNLVVACGSCNSRKGGRTPDQAGMRLRESAS